MDPSEKNITRLCGLPEVSVWLRAGVPVIFSLAPAFPGFVGAAMVNFWVGALFSAGATEVLETALALPAVIEQRWKAQCAGLVWMTSCPRVRVHFPEYNRMIATSIAPVLTPMAAHARLIRRRFGPDCRVVFLGPCRYKRMEAFLDPCGPDAVITFKETLPWIKKATRKKNIIPRTFSQPAALESRMAPIINGINGLDRVAASLENSGQPTDAVAGRTVELLGCSGGCLGGPTAVSTEELKHRRDELMKFCWSGLVSGDSQTRQD